MLYNKHDIEHAMLYAFLSGIRYQATRTCPDLLHFQQREEQLDANQVEAAEKYIKKMFSQNRDVFKFKIAHYNPQSLELKNGELIND